ncbi:MAG TPA: hypothetical protein VMH85_11775 [Terriglobales bacterium]|nr:hypothetical protein [Terriglobales bacterium]
MNELERGISRVLEEHQHESGLHVIGGRRRLIDRLMEFFHQEEEKLASEKKSGQDN